MSTPVNIRDARKICKDRQAAGVIVIALDDQGRISGASYATTKRGCECLGKVLDNICDSRAIWDPITK